MLVELGNRIVNTDHIVSAENTARSNTAQDVAVTLTTGETLKISKHPTTALVDFCGAVVPAPPGLVLIEAFVPTESRPGPKVNYWETAVIAFRVLGGVQSPMPIGLRGEPQTTNGSEYAVIQPDGRCVGWELTWPDREAFVAHCEDLAERNRASPDTRALSSQNAPTFVPSPAPSDLKDGDETNPLLALRARIQAEPIESVREKAPWRPGRDFAEVIEEVRAAYPDLHANGVGYNRQWGWKWGPGDQDRARVEMTAPGNVEAFEAALRFLSHAGRRFPQAKVNERHTVYLWKHVAERVMGVYIQTGILVAAAYALGFTVAKNDSPNPCINLGDKAVDLDPKRGL